MNKVEFEILDASDLIEADETGETFNKMIPNLLSNCEGAVNYLKALKPRGFTLCCCDDRHTEENSEEMKQRLQSHVAKFIRVKDKYSSLLSLLIKSREFHLVYETETKEGARPVIQLPKTSNGKPFIPTSKGSPSKLQFNVSHQHPFVGIARSSNGKMVGLDIVTFDDINSKLYANDEEFVQVFRGNFSESEWQTISGSNAILKEFFLQWAIKEAYTKALGVGMSMEFKSFTTKFEGLQGLWGYLSENSQNGNVISLRGSIHRENEVRTSPEPWNFSFHMLMSNREPRGCACICVPLDTDESGDGNPVEMNILETEALLRWHRQPVVK